MSNETYVYFDIYNHTNQLGVSSYALPFCEFRFIPYLDEIANAGVLSNTKILWVYGDGTTSRSLTGVHSYREPGTYQVYCYLYDNEGQSYLNTYSRNVIVSNYIPDKVDISINPLTSYSLTAGRIETPITVTRSNSYQTHSPDATYAITPYVSGSNLLPSYFDGISAQLYGHLEKYQSFYTAEVASSGITEFVETNSIITDSTLLYCCLSANEVIMVDKDHPYSFFCGTSGSKEVYYKSDMPADVVNLYFGFASDIFGVNTSTIGLSATIAPNTTFADMWITSNGIDGEETRLSTFDLKYNKFIGQRINFVGRLKDADGFSNKDAIFTSEPSVTIKQCNTFNNLPVCITLPSTVTITASANGSIKGYVVPEAAGDGCKLSILCVVSSSSSSTFTSLSVNSETFNILGEYNIPYDEDTLTFPQSTPYRIAKQGEYIDMTQSYKDLRFQELFLDNNNLFDNFLGAIVGNLSSSQDSIGKKLYEKIENFVDNNSNIDKSNIAQLVSILESVGDENILFEKSNFNFPAGLKRLIDLLSIKHSHLFGAKNTFDLDFYNYGNSSQYYGKNLGPRIDTLNYMVSAGTDLIALEKYSGKFKRLNTYIPLSSASVDTFMSNLSFRATSGGGTVYAGLYVPDPTPLYPETTRTWTKAPSAVQTYRMMQNLSGGFSIRVYSQGLNAWITGVTETRLSAYQPWTTFNWRFNNDPNTSGSLRAIQQYPNQYRLSAYDPSWGWGLILNDGYTPADIDKYYIFFEAANADQSVENSIINFDDFNTTLTHTQSSYSEWIEDNGMIDAMIAYQLAQGLNLI